MHRHGVQPAGRFLVVGRQHRHAARFGAVSPSLPLRAFARVGWSVPDAGCIGSGHRGSLARRVCDPSTGETSGSEATRRSRLWRTLGSNRGTQPTTPVGSGARRSSFRSDGPHQTGHGRRERHGEVPVAVRGRQHARDRGCAGRGDAGVGVVVPDDRRGRRRRGEPVHAHVEAHHGRWVDQRGRRAVRRATRSWRPTRSMRRPTSRRAARCLRAARRSRSTRRST